MAGPTRFPQSLWAGDIWPPLIWAFGPAGSPAIPEDATFTLEVLHKGDGRNWSTITARSEDGGLAVNLQDGTVAWAYTAGQSRGFAVGTPTYILRCHRGEAVQVWAYGPILMEPLT